MNEDFYLDWEWQPMDRVPDGCNEISLKDANGDITEMCSCDYWWKHKEYKNKFESFRFT